jgi:isocitrate dehydrogenase
MATYQFATVPADGERIGYEGGTLQVPNRPIVPFIEGDGTGPDIWRAAVRVFDAAVQRAYGGERKIAWMEVYAGEKSVATTGEWLPEETIEALREFRVSIKGPLSTPVGGGIRSLNVALRQILDLYACIRPVRYFEGVGAPVKEPQKLDIVIFRENTEDVYSGIEFRAGTPEAQKLAAFLSEQMGKTVREHSAIGIKPMSEFGSKRLVKMAIEYAVKNKRPSMTLVHKGNIMKFTEGAFRDWGYEVAKEGFGGTGDRQGAVDAGARRPRGEGRDRRRDVPAAPAAPRRVLGDRHAQPQRRLHLDAAAAQVGGLGMAPAATSATGSRCSKPPTAPRPSTPGSTRSTRERDPLGRDDARVHGLGRAAKMIVAGIEKAIGAKTVTYDLARQMPGAKEVSCSGFGDAIVAAMGA